MKLTRNAVLAWGILFVLLISAPSQSADIYLQIQRGEKATIGLPTFITKSAAESDQTITRKMHELAKSDILFSRLFNIMEDGPLVDTPRIDFPGWEKAGTDVLVTANVSVKSENTLHMVASLYEIPSGNPVFQKIYRGSKNSWRSMTHEFVADILFRFTGRRGVSESKIVFSNNATGSKELYTVDFDGDNLKRITADKSISMLPRWSPDGKEIIFTSFRSGNPDLYIHSLGKATTRAVSTRKGLNTSASFWPDGKQIAVTLSHEGSPSIYLVDRSGKVLRRLTNMKGADTSPSVSPDGRKILFTSDRPGWPQIYIMDADGSNVTRLTEKGYCDSPVWSPTGDKFAYSRGTDKGKHDIIVQDFATGNAFQITDNSGSNENPSFSPDGRYLVFTTTRNKKHELYLTSIDGSVQKKLADIPGESFTPSWGP